LGKELLDLLFDSSGGEDVRGVAEVLDGGEEAVGSDGDGNADGGEAGAEEVGAVAGAIDPALVDLEGGLVVGGEVFGNGAEVSSGLVASGDEIGLAGIFVIECAGVLEDYAKVLTGGAGQRGVPGERWQAVLSAELVGEVEEGFFVGGLGCDEWNEKGKDKKREEGCAHGCNSSAVVSTVCLFRTRLQRGSWFERLCCFRGASLQMPTKRSV
jgi:hypothetical protein